MLGLFRTAVFGAVDSQLKKLGLELHDDLLIISGRDIYRVEDSGSGRPRVEKHHIEGVGCFQRWNTLVAVAYGSYPDGMVKGLETVANDLRDKRGIPSGMIWPDGRTRVMYSAPAYYQRLWSESEMQSSSRPAQHPMFSNCAPLGATDAR